jgi:hypothetical protein
MVTTCIHRCAIYCMSNMCMLVNLESCSHFLYMNKHEVFWRKIITQNANHFNIKLIPQWFFEMYIVQYGCRKCVWSPSSLEPFTYFWKCHLKFQKLLKKYVHIDNDVYYKNANPQSQIHCIMGYTKKTKCNKVWRRTIRKPRSVIFFFFVQSKLQHFSIGTMHT